jgi:hypothetical protein
MTTDRPPTPDGLEPEDPRDAGLPPATLDIEEVEPAHELANQARSRLQADGFTDDEIDDWAREFAANEGGAGDADALVEWIRARER